MKKSKSWKSKIAALVTVFLLLFGSTSHVALAKNDNFNIPQLTSGKEGSLTVSYFYNGTTEKLNLPGAVFSCIKVADLKVENGSVKYQLAGGFATAGIDFEDMTAEKSHDAAAKLYAMAKEKKANMVTQPTNAQGKAVFEKLTPGMYLVAQEKKLRIGKAVYFAEPFLISVPKIQGTTKDYHWQYAVTAMPKTANRDMDKSPEPEPNPNPHPHPNPPSSHSGKTITGDPFHYELWGLLLAGAGITMISLLYYRRKAS